MDINYKSTTFTWVFTSSKYLAALEMLFLTEKVSALKQPSSSSSNFLQMIQQTPQVLLKYKTYLPS